MTAQRAAGRKLIIEGVLRRKLDRSDVATQSFIRQLEMVDVQLAARLPCFGIVRVDTQRPVEVPRSVAGLAQRECGARGMIEILRVFGAANRRGAMTDKTPPIFAARGEHDAQSVQRLGIAAIAPDMFAESR